ncbi:Putative porin [Alkalitalea saponilacus]|uniref:Putative porin n=2 Tax=Alkalitalea saponilacus TaxID=889453 RepID=A0A1T5HT32_9BACT|nr:Putative porin [Alkalitalea saponilacus]
MVVDFSIYLPCMRSLLILISYILVSVFTLNAQIMPDREYVPGGGRTPAQQEGHTDDHHHDHDHDHDHSSGPRPQAVEHKITNWFLKDLGTVKDTVPIDTLSQGFQIHNPANRAAIANVQLGNIGAPWQPAMVSKMPLYSRFLFADNLRSFFTEPEEWRYYNTRTPYTNLYYQYAAPKRRSEEVVGVLFTQNVNKRWNVGFDYQLISSIGRYEAQQVENRHFRFFSSYNGQRYQVHGSYVYNKTDQLENAGIEDDDYVLNPQRYDYDEKENIPIRFYDASNRIDNHQIYVNQALNIGNITVSRREGERVELPVGTAIHTFHLDRNRRKHRIENLRNYLSPNEPFFYDNIYIDTTKTRDYLYYTSIKNTFQLRFNEEANPLLQFGLRAFITNEVEQFTFPAMPEVEGTFTTSPEYLSEEEQLTSTLIGGQIFKNLGESFRWNAGMRLYFQGYRTGDTEITGAMNSHFRLANDTAGIYADGGLYLVSPGFFESRYTSNHFIWDERFDQVKTLRLGGAVKIPTRKFELSAETRLINDYFYWDQNAMPTQSGSFLRAIEFRLFKHFNLGNFHNHNTILYQLTSNSELMPLPEWSLYSSLYYQNTLFDVLFVQLGFDLRYNTRWYSPAYMPATGQFYAQRQRKTGDYPYVDLFLNMQLKRARIFIKMDHINQGYPSNDYFHTLNYPANPRAIRFGLSWNFYD